MARTNDADKKTDMGKADESQDDAAKNRDTRPTNPVHLRDIANGENPVNDQLNVEIQSEPVQMVKMYSQERNETVEVTPTQWVENQARYELGGFRRMDDDPNTVPETLDPYDSAVARDKRIVDSLKEQSLAEGKALEVPPRVTGDVTEQDVTPTPVIERKTIQGDPVKTENTPTDE